MKTFTINDYITLKLEGNSSIIYVKGERFNQCKYLLMEIPISKISSFDEIESIDEATKRLGKSLEGHVSGFSPKTEFWGQNTYYIKNYEERFSK